MTSAAKRNRQGSGWSNCDRCKAKFLDLYEFKARDILHLTQSAADVREYLDETLGEWHRDGHSDD